MRCRTFYFTSVICLCLSITLLLYITLDYNSARTLLLSRGWIDNAPFEAKVYNAVQAIHDDPNVDNYGNMLVVAPPGSIVHGQMSAVMTARQMRMEFRASVNKIIAAAMESAYYSSWIDVKDHIMKPSKVRQNLIGILHSHRHVRNRRQTLSLMDFLPSTKIPKVPVWQKYHKKINERGLPSDKASLDYIFNILRFGEVSQVDEIEKGTQIKLRVTFTDGTVAVVKPMRVTRMYQTPPDHFYFSDIERHNAEIAAFHLDWILKFYRAPPTVGRLFNISKEIKPYALEDFLSTFFVSPAGNICFRGQCKYFCDTAHAVCGKNRDMLEASVQLFLPVSPDVTWVRMMHPYRRSYSAKHLADWETNPDYCVESVFVDENFHSRLVLDMVDTCIFDFLMGNLDRHHLVKIEELGGNATTFHIDQGRGFGRHSDDDFSILAPLIQCCLIRFSTMKTLSQFAENGPNSLGQTLRRSLNSDLVKPVLLEQHYDAINRRLAFVLYHVKQCVRKVGDITRVVVDDGL